MKKAILILSILISVSLAWYFYTIDEVKSKAKAHENIEDYQSALEYYKEYAKLTNDNIDYANKLFEIASKQLEYGDYLNAESNLERYKSINLSGGWLFNYVDSALIIQIDFRKNRLAKEYVEIYENTDRLDEALDLYI